MRPAIAHHIIPGGEANLLGSNQVIAAQDVEMVQHAAAAARQQPLVQQAPPLLAPTRTTTTPTPPISNFQKELAMQQPG